MKARTSRISAPRAAAIATPVPRSVIALVWLVPVIVFARAVPYEFVRSWDDGRFILDRADSQHVSWDALVRMFSTVQLEAYHPLHLLSYWLDVPWFGPSPIAVHAVSLVLWLCALWNVYGVLRALEVPEAIAVIATLLCGVHPVQVEAVSWASGRKDVLALLFVASSLRLQLTAATPWGGRAWASRALYIAAVLAKTTALPLPLFGLCLDVWVRAKTWRQALLWQLPSLVLAFGVGAAVIAIWQEHAMVRTTLGGPELAALRVSQTLGQQWLTALWPSHTSPMYSTRSIGTVSIARTVACLSYVLLVLWAWRKRAGLALAGLVGFALWLAPASNVVPLYFPLQDRYASLPVFALSLAIAGALTVATPARRGELQLLAAIAVLALGLRTWQYQGVWHDELRLWGHAAQTQPDADYALLKLGEVRREAGELEGAIAAYRRAVFLDPQRKLAHAGLFEVVARRDERMSHVNEPSQARTLALRYYRLLDHPDELREFMGELWTRGYIRSVELPLQMLLVHEPLPDGALMQAGLSALRDGRTTLARFYLHAMKEPPDGEPLMRVYNAPYLRVVP